jgi:type VI protein secretion system component VasK
MKAPRPGLVHWLFVAVYLALYKFFVEPYVTPVRRWIVIGVGVVVFLAWLARDSWRTKRDLAEHLQNLEQRKQANRLRKEVERSNRQRSDS